MSRTIIAASRIKRTVVMMPRPRKSAAYPVMDGFVAMMLIVQAARGICRGAFLVR
jgi:hypothetical protein